MSMTEQLQKDQEILFAVAWEYEDKLPDYITDKFYDLIYPMSQIRGGVRVFPYIKIDEKKHFLGDLEVVEDKLTASDKLKAEIAELKIILTMCHSYVSPNFEPVCDQNTLVQEIEKVLKEEDICPKHKGG